MKPILSSLGFPILQVREYVASRVLCTWIDWLITEETMFSLGKDWSLNIIHFAALEKLILRNFLLFSYFASPGAKSSRRNKCRWSFLMLSMIEYFLRWNLFVETLACLYVFDGNLGKPNIYKSKLSIFVFDIFDMSSIRFLYFLSSKKKKNVMSNFSFA